MGSFLQGLAADRYLRQRFATSPSEAPNPALLRASRVTTAWPAGFVESYLCPRPLFCAYFLLVLQEVRLIYGWGTAIWLEGRERSPARRNVSKGWQSRMCQVPEIPLNSFTQTNISKNLKLREAAFTIQTLLDIPRYNSNYRAFQMCAAEVD